MPYLKPTEILQMKNINRYTLGKWLKSGLPYTQIGRMIRVKTSDLEAFTQGL